MSFSVSRCYGLALLLAFLATGGCLPSPQSQSDEEKEPHFLEGRSRVNAMDYAGAVESFQKALEANPHSGAAHFELGWLFDRKEPDAAAAIYHYEQYLALRPGAENTENVKQRILACKQELARAVSLGPITDKQQHELDRLAEENRQLMAQNKQLSDELAQWRAYYNGRGAPLTNALPQKAAPPPSSRQRLAQQEAPDRATSTPAVVQRSDTSPTSSTRTHTIRSGENLSQIARKYGVKLEALMAANPHLDPRRLRPGQTLTIP